MVGSGFGVDVEACLVLAVRSTFAVAFPWDWPTAPVFGSEMDDAALDSQDFVYAPAGESHMPVEIDFGSFPA